MKINWVVAITRKYCKKKNKTKFLSSITREQFKKINFYTHFGFSRFVAKMQKIGKIERYENYLMSELKTKI